MSAQQQLKVKQQHRVSRRCQAQLLPGEHLGNKLRADQQENHPQAQSKAPWLLGCAVRHSLCNRVANDGYWNHHLHPSRNL
ncbi:hypothetical protein [Pseudomonas sp.]|uniref:hypothetical protein n=1 Tax=Pseudomonas sp. TaxID=306 RepID=UPI0030F47FFE